MRMSGSARAWLGALLYVVLGVAWIVASDELLAAFFKDPAALTRLQTYKGGAYVLLTALLAYLLIDRAVRYERRAAATQRLMDDTFEQAGVGMAYLQPDGRIVQANGRLARLLGHPAADLAGRDVAELLHPRDRQAQQQRLSDLARGPVEETSRQARLLHREGHTVWALLTLATAQATDDEALPRVILVVQDISPVKAAEQAVRTSEMRLRDLVRGIPDYVFMKDLQGRYIAGNPALEALLQRPEAQIVGHTDAELFGAEQAVEFRAHDEAALRAGQSQRNEEWVALPDGSRQLLETTKTPLRDADGRIVGIVGVARDITARHEATERLRLAATVFESTREAIMVTAPDQRILSVNRAFTEMLGYAENEVLGRTPAMLGSGRHDRAFYATMWAHLQAYGHWQGEIWNRRKSGEIFPELLSISAVRDEQDRLTHYVAVFADISRLKDSEAEIEFLVHHDALTRLPNRLLFHSRLEQAIRQAGRQGRRMGVLMLDLDRFKDVNDSYGHLIGDELLRHVAQRLSRRLRRSDTLARLGGDEFALLLHEVKRPEDAARIAQTLIAAVARPRRLSNGVDVVVGATVGISLYPEHGETAEELLQGADAAMYQAKADGRGHFRYFSDDMTTAARERLQLEARLRHALDEGQLQVHFQPHVDIRSGRIAGAEALVRWHDPQEGMVPPARFIPLAEATGLITELGHFVLRETCRQGQAWLAAGLPPLLLAVNVSPRQFHHGDLVGDVRAVLEETGYPATLLELELTEGTLMERQEESVLLLARLREAGVRLAIDDFGTGYSSLAYLQRFPLDTLKIDRRFIADLPDARDGGAIASAIIAMGHNLGFKVLAEGVETQAQLDFLRSRGCDQYQGFLRSPAVAADAFEQLLRQEHETLP